MDIPKDLTEFLYWVKERTEKIWSIEDDNCPKGFYGAKWQPLSEEQIVQIEQKYAVSFTPEHKEFLKILHATDKKEIVEYEDEGELVTEECIFFYNWLEHEKEIREVMKEPYEWMFSDIESVNKVWLRSWGIKPKSLEKRREIFNGWFSHIPALLPLAGTRFIVSNNHLRWRPVLSVRGSDIVIMGWDFRAYLLDEISDHLDIYVSVFDEEYQMFYPEFIGEVQHIFDENFEYDETKDIPYLKEMILYWSSGWRGFGLNYYPENVKGARPIVKTYIAEEEK